jgi:geranylgeranyl diphosphate synthase type II
VNIGAYLDARRDEVEATLRARLPRPEGPAATLVRALRYAVEAGGKRLRPILALTCCEACDGDAAHVAVPAAALELIHTYSLIHDDLPAMDDDDLRRGKPTVHRVFGEAEAILAGDALNTLAFEWLATYPPGDEFAARRARVTALVAQRTGLGGMVGGQIADLEAEGQPADEERLGWIHRHKTAALLSAAAETGAIHAGADGAACAAMAGYGQQLGLAFQIVDDILDRTATSAALGKTPGKDQRAGKSTFPALYGLDESRRRAQQCVERALACLSSAGLRDARLAALARFTLARGS